MISRGACAAGRLAALGTLALVATAAPLEAQAKQADAPTPAPLTIGETFTLHSSVLGEERRINVYLPPG